MKLRKLGFLFCVILIAFLVQATGQAQDFHHSYSIGAGGQIRIHNISGDVKISGYSGGSIMVSAYKEGPDQDMVQVEDTSKGNLLELKVQYLKSGTCRASIRFELQVPKSIEYKFDDIASVSGNVVLEDVSGMIKAESVSGNVYLRDVTGTVNAHSVSGDVKAEIGRFQGTGDLKFSSVSGNVYLKAPADLDADIKMSSISGSVKTDFPIEIRKPQYGPGKSASGRLGAGSHNLRLSSISGNVNLNQKQR
jgi:hypothetical protein